MVFAMFAMLSWLYLVIVYTTEVDKEKGWFSNLWANKGFELYAWTYLLIALYSCLMVGQHAYFILQNITTNEMINRHRYVYMHKGVAGKSMFNRGRMMNIAEFFGAVPPVEVDLEEYYELQFAGGSVRDNIITKQNQMLALQNSLQTSSTGHGH